MKGKIMKLPKAYATSLKKQTIDLTISVNPLGCAPSVVRALKSITRSEISAYPDQTRLLSQLSASLNIPRSFMLLGNGSEQLIKLISQALILPGDTVFVERGSFFLFSKEPKLRGANIVFFDLVSPPAPKTRPALVFMANPTTPGGEDRPNPMLIRAISRINPVTTVVDEANEEFCTETLIPETRKRPNILILRTFSKALGLAGLRLGFVVGNPKLIRQLNEFQQPFPVTSLSLRAAEAALRDRAFLEKTIRFVAKERKFLSKELTRRGFGVSTSVTNNLFVTRRDSKRIIRELTNRGVGVIDGAFFPGERESGFRLSLRDRKTNRQFLAVLDEVLACLPKNLLRSKEDL